MDQMVAYAPLMHPDASEIYPYTIREVLGSGAYATVYKACDSYGNQVALKIIRLENESEGVPSTALREISTMKHMHHENVLRLLHINSTPKLLSVAFELADFDLKRYMDFYNGPLPPHRSFMYQILQGVRYIHNMMILHRDIKPRNLLVFSDGIIKLADFGLSRAFSAPASRFTHEVVTLWYRPPDSLLGNQSYDTGIDIWSLGCVFAEMLEGRPLFSADSIRTQLIRIFQVLGSPAACDMPCSSRFVNQKLLHELPRFPKGDLAKVVPHADLQSLDLLKKMLTYNERERISAEDALLHPYFLLNLPIQLIPLHEEFGCSFIQYEERTTRYGTR